MANAQVTIFSENIGTPTGTTSIASYTGWQNKSVVSFSGTAEVRNSSLSTGYTGASGGGNIFFTNIIGRNFIISGINTSNYSSLSLSFGIWKSLANTSKLPDLKIEVSTNGINYTSLTYSTLPSGKNTNIWYLRTAIGTIPSTSNLRIRFTQNSNASGFQYRLDDIKLTGICISQITFYTDADGDGFGAGNGVSFCANPGVGYATQTGDCNDANAAIKPNATEICNGIDDDCDGLVDEGLIFTNYYTDADGDGYGSGSGTLFCANPGVGYAAQAGDCNDANAAIKPNATEICNGIDDDCDGLVDEGLIFANYYTDADGDGYGSGSGTLFCANPGAGYAAQAGDCNDFNASVIACNTPCDLTNITNNTLSYGTLNDQEGNVYKTIQIGTQIWMAENLRTTIYQNGDIIPAYNSFNPPNGTWAYNNNDATMNCPYGKLYDWYAAVDNRNICPSGWHVPADAEWITLETFLGGKLIAGSKLKSTEIISWPSPNTDATNSSGFSGLAGGIRSSNNYDFVGKGGWWSRSESSLVTAWSRYLNYGTPEVFRLEFNKLNGLSVRCIKDEVVYPPQLITIPISGITDNTAMSGGNNLVDGGALIFEKGICWSTSPEPTTANNKFVAGSGGDNYSAPISGLLSGTVYYMRAYAINSAGTGYGQVISFTTTPPSTAVHTCGSVNVHNPALTYGKMTDQQGNEYKTIIIGTQEWMAENLKTSIYRNGDPISYVPGNTWGSANSGAWCHFNNDPSKECPYGKLYNGYAIRDNRNVCPSGWHIPTKDELFSLLKFLDPSSYSFGGLQIANAGTKMRNTGTEYWIGPNIATNSTGFSALPAGNRGSSEFSFSGSGAWWTSTSSSSWNNWVLNITNNDDKTKSNVTTFSNGTVSGTLYLTGNLAVGSPNYPISTGISVRCLRDNVSSLRINNNNYQNNTKKEILTSDKLLKLIILSNPTRQQFGLKIQSNDPVNPIQLRIIDINGRLVEMKSVPNLDFIISVGANYPKGIFFAEVIQGNMRTSAKLVKTD